MEQQCPLCDRHCPADSPRCGRGRAYFSGDSGQHPREERTEGTPEPRAVRRLRQIGHALLHAGEGTNVLQGLSPEEVEALERLLDKCLSALPAHHARRREQP